jgi:hypothetical protein
MLVTYSAVSRMLFTNFLRGSSSSRSMSKGSTVGFSRPLRRALSDSPSSRRSWPLFEEHPEMLTTLNRSHESFSDSAESFFQMFDSLLKRIRASKAPVNLVLGLPLTLAG